VSLKWHFRLVVVVQDKIHIYSLPNAKFVQSLEAQHPIVRLALSPSSVHCYLAYSDGVSSGQVSVYDARNLSPRLTIEAHRSPVLRLVISQSGLTLATCSCKVS
jgi:WD40 repeat protein